MQKKILKKVLPHAIAVAVFFIIAALYCKPALDGKVVNQSDITNWKGAVQQSLEYGKTHNGNGPLWTNSVFSGMPAFQIGGVKYNNFVPGIAHKILTLGMPEPISFFFLACICFYFLCMVLRVNTFAAVMGSLAFAYATYNPVIISVGHVTKMLTIAYMPALLASVLLIYESKKYWLGAGLTALFTSLLIAMNHPQIAYYLFIAISIMTLFFIINWIKQKDFKGLALGLGFTVAGALIGLGTNAVGLMSTYEFQKETIRGGGSALSSLTDTTAKQNNTGNGLSRRYGMSYSMKIAEPLVMFAPRIFGGASDKPQISESKSKAVENLQKMSPEAREFLLGNRFFNQDEEGQLFTSTYWGGMTYEDEVGNSGPPYIGAIICFMAIVAMFVSNTRHKWWIFTAIIVSVAMSWGHYFGVLNNFLFDNLPFYNKFRAPSMILVIPQLLLPLIAALGLNSIINSTDRNALWSKYKKALFATGGLIALLFLIYLMADYMGYQDVKVMKQVRDSKNDQLLALMKQYYSSLVADRKSLFMNDILRSAGFILIAASALYLTIKKTIKPVYAAIIITFFAFLDVILFDSNYLSSKNYQDKSDNETVFAKTKADEDILADSATYPYRVYNMSRGLTGDGVTSYYHNSIGGYNAAKILIYQDLIERQLNRQNTNQSVLDMLNVRYLIQSNEQGQTGGFQKRETNLGHAWFVKQVLFVKNADEEMKALDNFNPKDTAFVQESFKSSVTMPVPDSAASISLVKNDNDVIDYTSASATNQFAVFSEIYYKSGWKAYIDGKEAPIVKVNYVLRGLSIPAGKHTIKFEFKPQGYYQGRKITGIANIVLLLLLAGGIFAQWYYTRKK